MYGPGEDPPFLDFQFDQSLPDLPCGIRGLFGYPILTTSLSKQINPTSLCSALGRFGADVRMLSHLENGVQASKARCDGEDGNISLGSSRWLLQEGVLGTCSGFAFHVVCVHAGS